jgi:hypothetical protein
MEKIFCDFCNNEINVGEACKVELSDPRVNDKEGYMAHRSFDACRSCFLKLRNFLGIKS